ncbi:MAG: hypothetical protein AAFN92_11740 [Bacteroidota bacterium]
MRYLIVSAALLFFVSCATTTAGVNVGAQQKFVLGEYMTKPYKASLENKGEQDIAIRLIDKRSQETVREITLAPGDRTTVKVDPTNQVEMLNDSDSEGLVKARMNRGGVPGMEYRGLDDKQEKWTDTSWLDTDQGGAKPRDAKRFPFVQVAEIPAGATFYFAEKMPAGYSAILHNQGSPNVNVKIRSRENGKQTQGFGMGRNSKPIVNLSENEVLTLVNNGSKPARIKLKLNEDLKGGRVK